MEHPGFREGCIDYYGSAPDAWAEIVFWQCLYEHAVIPARFIRRVEPSFFEPDFQLIRTLAGTSSLAEFQNEANDFFYRRPPVGILRANLRIRVSGKRILRVGALIFTRTSARFERIVNPGTLLNGR